MDLLVMVKAVVKSMARSGMRAGLEVEVNLFAFCFSSEDKH